MKKEKKKKRIKREPQPAILQTVEAGETKADSADELLQYTLTVVGGKWKIRILWALRDGASLRYGEIKQKIPAITDMMLSQSLRELTADALIARQQYQQIPPKVEYRITPVGAELIPSVELLNAWAAKSRKGD